MLQDIHYFMKVLREVYHIKTVIQKQNINIQMIKIQNTLVSEYTSSEYTTTIFHKV